jgi:hypothetical protein
MAFCLLQGAGSVVNSSNASPSVRSTRPSFSLIGFQKGSVQGMLERSRFASGAVRAGERFRFDFMLVRSPRLKFARVAPISLPCLAESRGQMTSAPERARFVATLTSDTTSQKAEINALNDFEAIETATTWATRIMADRAIDSGTLGVTRNGVEIRSFGERGSNARRT